MTADAPPIASAVLHPTEVAGIWLRHLTSLLLPINALAFLWTGPHSWYVATLFVVPTLAAFWLDGGQRLERRQPDPSLPAWPFDLLVYLLGALQLLVVFGIGRLFAHQELFSVDMVMMFLVVGGSSGFSIITAHELIHRRIGWERNFGRLLLCTVLQEHFFTEHLRGHHVRVGLADDPATARFGESYQDFYRRTVPAQFRSAWTLEARRLGDPEMSLLDPRMRSNRILHGLIVGWGIGFTLLAVCGFSAFVAFLIQAFFASRLLEAVNYFEHWGLTRAGSRIRPEDSWDTHSWFTYYGLTGLSRHADHHYEQTRAFQQLRVYEDVPLLPFGYVVMVDLVMVKNAEFQRLATEELRRCRLGPFAPGAGPLPTAQDRQDDEPGRVSRRAAVWTSLPGWARGGIAAIGFLAVVTLGGQLASIEPAAAMSHVGRLAWNGSILAAFVLAFRAQGALETRSVGGPLAWTIVLFCLVPVGLALDQVAALLR